MGGEMRNGWGMAEWIRLMVLVGLIALITAGPASGDVWAVVAAAAGQALVQVLAPPLTARPLPPAVRDRAPGPQDGPAPTEGTP
ncbi:hypothetical protein [Streptomyces sp. NPDC048349]|uniref:hypothetical protein n=1 Tax=Streptomyces sp. NPDC048349 TaxID=3155486 RepID=UPI00342C95C8